MLKLFRTTHGLLSQTQKIQFKNPNFFVHNSHLHKPIKTLVSDSEQGFKSLEQRDPFEGENVKEFDPSSFRISHPWPEWVELMERLLKNGYFEGVGNPFQKCELDAKDANRIRTACLNFARDRFDLIRYFSRTDIWVVAGSGCPVIDRKVVNSGKRLRAHVGITEGNVCSSCILRGNCERAYVKAREGEGGRTVDVMRFLLTYGLDPVTDMVENKLCLNKLLTESVRRLLRQMVEHSKKELISGPPAATFIEWNSSVPETSTYQDQGHINASLKQGDWICSKCNFINFARNTNCLHCDGLFRERVRKIGEGQHHLALKKGDWICVKCNFLNFAKNTRCMQCNEKPPKRKLNPGEWECDSCNYINFRRNTVCIKCNHRRPRISDCGDTSPQPHDNHQRTFDVQERPRRDRS